MRPQTIKRFRIRGIQGPAVRGLFEQFRDYSLDIELDPGAPYSTEHARATVSLDKTVINSLTHGDARDSPCLERGQRLVWHYVTEKLKSMLVLPGTVGARVLSPTSEEMSELGNVDPARISTTDWIEVHAEVALKTGRVFISCGQRSQAEKDLGNEIAKLVRDKTGLDGYFAENQQNMDGVTQHIFKAIHASSGFIAVMHRRDCISTGSQEFRGSVWIEQEIAIAAFLVQALGVSLPSKVYLEKGIRREGVRGFIILNPVEFSSHHEVLSDLESWWPVLKQNLK